MRRLVTLAVIGLGLAMLTFFIVAKVKYNKHLAEMKAYPERFQQPHHPDDADCDGDGSGDDDDCGGPVVPVMPKPAYGMLVGIGILGGAYLAHRKGLL